MKVVIDRCKVCGQPLLWDNESDKLFKLCACDERDPNCCSDGACDGMCGCGDKEEKE